LESNEEESSEDDNEEKFYKKGEEEVLVLHNLTDDRPNMGRPYSSILELDEEAEEFETNTKVMRDNQFRK
jgi:hypothetical protein